MVSEPTSSVTVMPTTTSVAPPATLTPDSGTRFTFKLQQEYKAVVGKNSSNANQKLESDLATKAKVDKERIKADYRPGIWSNTMILF